MRRCDSSGVLECRSLARAACTLRAARTPAVSIHPSTQGTCQRFPRDAHLCFDRRRRGVNSSHQWTCQSSRLRRRAAAEFVAALRRMGLLGTEETPPITPLTGGVSSDIVRADLEGGPVCIKRALPKLKVKADWRAPVERNRWEVEWMRTAARSCRLRCRASWVRTRGRHVRHGVPRRARASGVEGAAARRRHRSGVRGGRSAAVSRRIHAATAGDDAGRASRLPPITFSSRSGWSPISSPPRGRIADCARA